MTIKIDYKNTKLIHLCFYEYNNINMSEIKGPTTRRDHLLKVQNEIQLVWGNNLGHEGVIDETKEKYFVTFPYPYMNGTLHVGHAFTLSKAEFAARYQKLKGKQVLFPFSFHCTGMPIVACALKLKRELEKFGTPPKFPSLSIEPQQIEKTEKKKNKKGKAASKKSSKRYQYEILEEMGVPINIIPNFIDPIYWTTYFPELAMKDLQDLGVHVDWRRSFITTELNHYYDMFVRWQFNKLKEKEFVKYGTRMCIYSPSEKQPCADHDRSIGEGVKPKKYTIIKQEVIKPENTFEWCLENKNTKVCLLVATTRPEMIVGQTNIWVDPQTTYNMHYSETENTIFICSGHAAYNMMYQTNTIYINDPLECWGGIDGSELVGLKVNSPYSENKIITVLPATGIKISSSKGTGLVMSVPSEAPSDYHSYVSLQKDSKLQNKYNIDNTYFLPIVECIKTDKYDVNTGIAVYNIKKMSLEDKTIEAYKESLKGTMRCGIYKDTIASEAMVLMEEFMIINNACFEYWEPENTVISRSNTKCVCKYEPQWYIDYGCEKYKSNIKEYVDNDLNTYSNSTKTKFQAAYDWLGNHGFSRSFGLGTYIPWAKDFLIDSLSDSTIYMAFYTIAHIIKKIPKTDFDEKQSDMLFDHVFLNKQMGMSNIPQDLVECCKKEFDYWYPLDLRVSGKDLITNHLTMCLYNHNVIWDEKMMPKSFFTNGHVLLNGEKMSKSTGNFMTLHNAINKYSSDATRFALAESGDTNDDANFTFTHIDKKGKKVSGIVDSAILNLTREENWIIDNANLNMRQDEYTYWDKLFDTQINRCISESMIALDSMKYRIAISNSFHKMSKSRDTYRTNVEIFHKTLFDKWTNAFLIMNSIFCPHLCDYIWIKLGKDKLATTSSFPECGEINEKLEKEYDYLQKINQTIDKKLRIFRKDKKMDNIKELNIYVTPIYINWQQTIIDKLKEMQTITPGLFEDKKEKRNIMKTLYPIIKELPCAKSKKGNNKVMGFVNQLITDFNSVLNDCKEFDEKSVIIKHIKYIASHIEREIKINVMTIDVNKDDSINAMPFYPALEFVI